MRLAEPTRRFDETLIGARELDVFVAGPGDEVFERGEVDRIATANMVHFGQAPGSSCQVFVEGDGHQAAPVGIELADGGGSLGGGHQAFTSASSEGGTSLRVRDRRRDDDIGVIDERADIV